MCTGVLRPNYPSAAFLLGSEGSAIRLPDLLEREAAGGISKASGGFSHGLSRLLTGNHLVSYSGSVDVVFRALADPTRRALLDALYERDGQTLVALTARHDLTRVGIAKHLRLLEEAGLVVDQTPGPGEAALPEPRPDPAGPRPLGQQVHRALGRRPDRPESGTGAGHGEDLRDLHPHHARNACGRRSPIRRFGPSTTSGSRSSRLGPPVPPTRWCIRPRTGRSPRGRTSSSSHRTGWCRPCTRSGARRRSGKAPRG